MNIADHLHRASFQLGRRAKYPQRSFRLAGYHPSNFVLNCLARHEERVLKVMARRLPSLEGAFLDVGVNIGQTLHKVMTIDPQREYYGFEPLLSCCADVARFAELNGLSNIHVLPIGLSNENRIATFYSRDATDSSASLIPYEGTSRTSIQLRKGDEVVEELGIGKIAALKVDVEGAEWQVFDGSRATLKRDKPMLLFEVLSNYEGQPGKSGGRTRIPDEEARANNERLLKLRAILAECDYTINRILDDGSEQTADAINLDDRNYVSNDYVAIA